MADNMKSEGYSNRLLDGLRGLQTSDELCDLTLTADNYSVKVHRAVLAASSDYFRALLTVDMRERDQPEVRLQGVPGKGLREIIRFIYTGKLGCTLDNVTDVLLAASHLQQIDALSLCCRYLIQLTTPQNSVDMFNTSEQFNLPALKDKAVSLILAHFDEIATKDDFLRFSPGFLTELFADNRLKMFSELNLYKLVLRWIRFDEAARLPHLYPLMSRVRFPLIQPSEFVTEVMSEKIMKSDPQCLELILEANTYHLLPHMQALLQTERTQLRNNISSLVMLDVDDDGPRVFDLGSMSWTTMRNTKVETFHSQVAVLNNYMYVCGGIELYSSNNPVSGKCYRFDPRFDRWSEIATLQEPRHHFAFVADGQTLYAIGGYCNGVFKNVVEQYDVAENRWLLKSPIEIRVSAAAAAALHGKIYLTGGQTDRGASRGVYCYDAQRDNWVSRTMLLQARMEHAVCAHGSRLYVFGGYSKNIIRAYDVNTVESYHADTDQWTVVAENTPKISGIHCCVVDADVYIAAGFTYDENKKQREIWAFSLTRSEWRVAARLPSPAMAIPICALYLRASPSSHY